MSRLIIKNLPSYITPARLQDHFESKKGPGGSLTDVKVALKPDGTSRRFGFVGYKTEKQATAGKEWFDRTFIDSTRISVSVVEVRCILFSCFLRVFLFDVLIFSGGRRVQKTLLLHDQINGHV
jgi:RNA recognition motif. (a.k.a. RRM, RBD, or RNP domain)